MPDVKLIHGDCLEVMRGMEDNSVDAVVTDPPYGLNFLGNEWDLNIPDWIKEGRRIGENVAFTTAPTTLWDYPRPDWVCCWHRKHASSRAVKGGFNLWSPILYYGTKKIPADFYATHFGTYWRKHKNIDHPSPKPVELYKWILEWISEPGDTILDPFMGSGTTGVACVQTGRNFIGIEIDERYFAIAQHRIKDALQQPGLFA